jgi:rubrerythrin
VSHHAHLRDTKPRENREQTHTALASLRDTATSNGSTSAAATAARLLNVVFKTESNRLAAANDFRVIAEHARRALEESIGRELELLEAQDLAEDRAAARTGKTYHVCPVCEGSWWGEPDEQCTLPSCQFA